MTARVAGLFLALSVALGAAGCLETAILDGPDGERGTRDPQIQLVPGASDSDGQPEDPGAAPDGALAPAPDGGAAVPGDDGGSLGAPDTQATTPAPPPGTCGNDFETEVFHLVNAERTQRGLPAYLCDAPAGAVARAYSQLMCDQSHFSHTGPDGSQPWDRLRKGGVDFVTAGENIALGQTSPQKVMTSWMNSPGHRANILSSKFTHIGVGYVYCASGSTWRKHYWTQNFFR